MRNLAALLTVLALSSTTACVPLEADSIQSALPTADSVSIDVPQEGKALGDVSGSYRITRELSEGLNGMAGWVLILVHQIVQYPPTTVERNVYTWGPHSEALDPAEWRLTVTENDDGTYGWVLDARSKFETDSEFLPIISGSSTPGTDPHHGNGVFSLDFDNAEIVDPDGNDGVGRLEVDYDLGQLHGDPVALTMGLTTVQNGEQVSFEYAYGEERDGSGTLDFGVHADLDENGSLEDLRIHSRWTADGQGRADLAATGGELGTTTVMASECWDTQFRTVYYADSASWQEAQGEESTCAFTEAAYPSL